MKQNPKLIQAGAWIEGEILINESAYIAPMFIDYDDSDTQTFFGEYVEYNGREATFKNRHGQNFFVDWERVIWSQTMSDKDREKALKGMYSVYSG